MNEISDRAIGNIHPIITICRCNPITAPLEIFTSRKPDHLPGSSADYGLEEKEA